MLNDCGKKNQYQGNYVFPDNHDFSSNLVLRSYSSADDHNKRGVESLFNFFSFYLLIKSYNNIYSTFTITNLSFI